MSQPARAATPPSPILLRETVGSIAVLAALGWVILRYLSPPKIRVLQVSDADPE